MEHLARRKGSANWYYRERIPDDVRAILAARDGRAPLEKWATLSTPDRKLAKERLVKAQAAEHARWDELRAFAAGTASDLPTIGEVADAAFDMVHTRFVAVHRRQLKEQFAQHADVSGILAQRKQALALSAILPSEKDQLAMEKLALAVATERKWDLRRGTIEGAALHDELVRLVTLAVRLARADVIDELEGRVPETSRERVLERMGVTPQKRAEPGATIIELFDLYAAGARKKKDTLDTERKLIVQFANFVGVARDVASVTKAEFREFRNALQKVPVNWQLRGDLKDLPLREVARKWSAAGGSGRNAKTVAREWSGLSTFYAWLVKEGYCDDNLTTGLAPRFDKRAGKLPTYSHAKLTAVFSSPLFHQCAGDDREHLEGQIRVRDWRYWIPLCAAYSGARAGEIAQLLPSDIRQEDGVWVFDFAETAEDSDDPKSLKTVAARRIVPVHGVLLNLGLLDLVKQARAKGDSRLFPEIVPCQRGMFSTQVSKFWQLYLKRLGVKERGLALHSFRHTFADEVRRKGGSDAVLGSILGHSKGTITAHYGTTTEGNLTQRQALINAVDYRGLHSLPAEKHDAIAA